MSIYIITNVSHNQIINILNTYQSLFPNFLGDVFILSVNTEGSLGPGSITKRRGSISDNYFNHQIKAVIYPIKIIVVDFSIFFSLQRNTNRHTYPNTFLIIAKKYQWTLNANKKNTLKKVISLLCKQE